MHSPPKTTDTTPMTPLVLDREAVARLIDPNAWAHRAFYHAQEWKDRRDISLTKADSIIALTSQAGGLVEAERASVIEEAAYLLDRYAEFIRSDVKADDLERHPYLPSIEACADDLRSAIRASNPSVGGGV